MAERVLVIKLSALGDMVLAFAPFAAIRAHHPTARITLLTTAPYADWMREAPWFDVVEVDTRPAALDLRGLWRLSGQLRRHDLVYDLQTSGRSTRYFWLAGCPPWSGIGAFRRFRHRDPARDRLHTVERQRGQLRDAGIDAFPRPDLAWLRSAPAPDVPPAYALLVPGAAPHRPDKRWPAPQFGALAAILAARGLTPVVVGTAADRPLAAAIRGACSQTLDLTGHTDLAGLAGLAARATLAVGNDTGPMHLAAALGCQAVVLFGYGSDPALTAPVGPDGAWATVLRVPTLADLDVEQVAALLA